MKRDEDDILRGQFHMSGAGAGTGFGQFGQYGAAHVRTRDAYRDVPILKKPTWNEEIVAYFFLGGVSSGAFVLGALAELCGGQRRKRLARMAHYVAFATLLPCPPLLITDLGRPSRFHHMLRIVKPSSPMNLGAWALTLHGAMSTVTVLRLLAADGKLPLPLLGGAVTLLPERALAIGGIPSALTLGGYTGVLLGTTSIPVWYTSPLLGALFMASALSTGTAATGLALALDSGDNSSARQAIAPLHLACGVSELALLAGYVATSGQAAKPLLKGRPGRLIAGAALALASALVIEAASLRHTGGNKALPHICAAGATLVGGALLRWGVVHAGQLSAQDHDGTLEAMKPSGAAPGWSKARTT